ncbi:MAG: hypothetical protein WD042_15715 [Phycisphaeraceae bacterium]
MQEQAKPEAAEPPDLDMALDQLLADADREATLAARNHTDTEIPATEAADTPVMPTPSAVPDAIEPVAKADDLVGDALANQIQEMLDDAEAQLGAGHFQAPGEVQAEADQSQATSATQAAAAIPPKRLADTPAQRSATPAAKSPEAARPSVDFLPVGVVGNQTPDNLKDQITQLDDDLADGADHAIAGDFETVQDVMAQQPMAEAVAAPVAGQVVAEPNSPSSARPAKPAAAAVATPPAAPAGALRSEPSKVVAAAPVEHATGEGAPADAVPADAAPRLTHQQALVRASVRLRSALALINAPLARVSPATRDLVGYVGAMTIATSMLLIITRLLF